MKQLGKICAASALSLCMGLALLSTGAFAQSASPSASQYSSATTSSANVLVNTPAVATMSDVTTVSANSTVGVGNDYHEGYEHPYYHTGYEHPYYHEDYYHPYNRYYNQYYNRYYHPVLFNRYHHVTYYNRYR